MSNQIEVKTAELVGVALDWAVGVAEGWEPDRPQDGQLRKTWRGRTHYVAVGKDAACADWHRYTPSTDWRQGGPLIEREGLETARGNDLYFPHGNERGDYYEPLFLARTPGGRWIHGRTVLEAAMRCLVRAKLGDTIDIPQGLL